MGVKVSVPAPLRQYCDKKKEIELEGSTVKDVLASMQSNYSLLYEKVCEEDGSVRQYVNLFINGKDIRKQNNLDTELSANDSLTIIPAVAGGMN